MKYYGPYTKDAKKALKAERLICDMREDGIYLTTGFVVFKMSIYDYDTIIRPVVCCDPGEWEIDSNGKHENTHRFDVVEFFCKAVEGARDCENMQRYPFNRLPTKKDVPEIAIFFDAKNQSVAYFNANYINALEGVTIKSNNPLEPAVAFRDDEPIAIIMPITMARNEDYAATNRAVEAYFTPEPAERPAAGSNAEIELAEERRHSAELSVTIDEYAAALRAACDRADTLERELAELRAAAESAKEPTETIEPTEPKTSAADIAAKFSGLEGCTVTVKGEKTAAPVVWVSGDTRPHKAALMAAGLRWSAKKSAWYYRAA